MILKIPFEISDRTIDQQKAFEDYLLKSGYVFNKRPRKQEYYIQIAYPIDAYWIGCNMVAKTSGMFKSSITE